VQWLKRQLYQKSCIKYTNLTVTDTLYHIRLYWVHQSHSNGHTDFITEDCIECTNLTVTDTLFHVYIECCLIMVLYWCLERHLVDVRSHALDNDLKKTLLLSVDNVCYVVEQTIVLFSSLTAYSNNCIFIWTIVI
jgi:hypothetical protein